MVQLTSILAILGLFPSLGEVEDGEVGFVLPVDRTGVKNVKRRSRDKAVLSNTFQKRKLQNWI